MKQRDIRKNVTVFITISKHHLNHLNLWKCECYIRRVWGTMNVLDKCSCSHSENQAVAVFWQNTCGSVETAAVSFTTIHII